MPYVRCKSCGVLTYCVRGEQCPSCDAELLPMSSRAPARPPLATGLRRTLALAARQLGMEAGVLGEVTDGREVVRRVGGNAEALGISGGMDAPLAETYCLRLLEGRMPRAVPDTRSEPAVAELPATREIGIRSYGVAESLRGQLDG
jgi:hypothetical protein